MTLDPEDALNNIFDVESTTNTIEPEVVTSLTQVVSSEIVAANTEVELSKEEKDASEDYEFTREKLKQISITAQGGLEESLQLARSLDKPAGFDALANMIRSTVEVHKALHELHKSSAEIRISTKTANSPSSPVNVEKGIVFAGTAEDLLRMIDPTRT